MKENEFYSCIEESIRPLVKLLRDHGFNTYSSCGHEMNVYIQWNQWESPVDGEINMLKRVLFENGYKDRKFRITSEVTHRGHDEWCEPANITVHILDEKGMSRGNPQYSKNKHPMTMEEIDRKDRDLYVKITELMGGYEEDVKEFKLRRGINIVRIWEIAHRIVNLINEHRAIAMGCNE